MGMSFNFNAYLATLVITYQNNILYLTCYVLAQIFKGLNITNYAHQVKLILTFKGPYFFSARHLNQKLII